MPRPVKELKGFARLALAPGESKRAEVVLYDRAFAYFDPKSHAWTIAPGAFEILVGSSSATIKLRGSATVR